MMKRHIVLVSGNVGCGKTTFARMFHITVGIEKCWRYDMLLYTDTIISEISPFIYPKRVRIPEVKYLNTRPLTTALASSIRDAFGGEVFARSVIDKWMKTSCEYAVFENVEQDDLNAFLAISKRTGAYTVTHIYMVGENKSNKDIHHAFSVYCDTTMVLTNYGTKDELLNKTKNLYKIVKIKK